MRGCSAVEPPAMMLPVTQVTADEAAGEPDVPAEAAVDGEAAVDAAALGDDDGVEPLEQAAASRPAVITRPTARLGIERVTGSPPGLGSGRATLRSVVAEGSANGVNGLSAP